eukprot:1727177-Rhodomonas_salina.5
MAAPCPAGYHVRERRCYADVQYHAALRFRAEHVFCRSRGHGERDSTRSASLLRRARFVMIQC